MAVEQLQVGQRVRADAPTDELDLQFGTEVVSEDWRKLTLLAPKRDGSTADVVLQSDATVLPQAGAAANVEARTSAAEPATRLVAIEQL